MQHLPFLPVGLPLVAGILLLWMRDGDIRLRRALGLAASALLLAVAVALLVAVLDQGVLVYRMGDWPAPFGIVLVADLLAAWMVLVTGLLAPFALLYASLGTDLQGRHFHVFFQLQLFGLNGAFLTGDLFNLFVFYEVLLLASYGLLLHGGGRERTRAGLHYVVVNLVGSTLFLFAVGTLYGVLGTLNMADLAQRVAAAPPENAALVRTAGLLLFVVFALKAALVPLYLWLPRAYAHTSAPVAALFAVMTKLGAYSILRVHTLIFGPEAGVAAELWQPWLLPLALATVAIGTFGAMASPTLRLQLAYLIVVSAGTVLTAVGLGGEDGLAAALYYLAHSTFAGAAFFLLADMLVRERGDAADALVPAPAAVRARLLGAFFVITAMATAGMPPLSGFLGKYLVLQAAVGGPAAPWVLGVVLVTGVLGVVMLARSGNVLFYRARPAGSAALRVTTPTLAMVPLGGLLALGVGLMLAAGPALELSSAAAAQVLDTGAYQRAVLGGTGGMP